ncbi:DUF3822 family protein [Flavobacterium selenitireducens]|uniref:DUF3822 family protein n=1 Tax=Flavobacterium selenitireducens TaxID=2722704 RepID=UPI00168B9AA4|nr:DUF3822 family protein [Flavobacterium selenitireducens]MBD3581153.1 DUF3822 family protein [Flavobacterium selenitireducens]
MLVNRPNITEKNYRKLSLRVRPDGFSYCTTDTLSGAVVGFEEVRFTDVGTGHNAEEFFVKAFADRPELQQRFDQVVVTHENGLSTFVPKALFDEHYLGSYLQYNVKVFETDYVAYDELPNYEMNNVYLPFLAINNFVADKFGNFEYKHLSSVLVSKLLEGSKNNDEKQVFAHFADHRFELVVAQNQKLLLFNSFDYRTKEDFIYYLLFAAEQLNLNPEFFKLHLLGDISEDSDCYQIAYRYVRNVSLLDVSRLQSRNALSESENRKHFILFQS